MLSRLFAILGLMLLAMSWVLYVTGTIGMSVVCDDPIMATLAALPLLALIAVAAFVAIRPE